MKSLFKDKSRNTFSKKVLLLCLLLYSSFFSFAHVVVQEMEKMSKADTAILYLKLGYQHILPLGLDHILFVLSLFLLSPKLKPVLWQSLAFTIAHSVTLGLAMYSVIKPSGRIVEPLIALSIMYVALENIFSPRLKPSRIGVVFCFGLVHGLGFASSLSNLGLPSNSFLTSLVMFNAGVELGQFTVILTAWYILAKSFGNKPGYRKYIVVPLSLLIALIAAYWTIQRIFLF
ncbi:MAG: HupE/UreJ family protein [Bacteroidota bacterium]